MPFDKKRYAKEYYQKHKREQKLYREQHKEERKAYMKEWYRNHREKQIREHRENRKKQRLEVLTHYGGNPPKCACCGESHIEFLGIDHIHGGGRKHRRNIGGAARFYAWLIKNNFPDEFQVLCMNCNFGKRMNNGVCPHKRGV